MANFKYKQLADWLKDQLKNGTFLAGQKIPTESDLAEQFALSRRTVRQAAICTGSRAAVPTLPNGQRSLHPKNPSRQHRQTS